MEAFLHELLPRLFPKDCLSFQVHAFQCKPDMLGNLQARLKGYAHWLPDYMRIVVVVDCDDDDGNKLKQQLESAATAAGLRTRSGAKGTPWQVVNRIAIEELEAWYFGDWKAVRSAYPKVSPTVPNQAKYRDPDEIKGGTWEAFERLLKKRLLQKRAKQGRNSAYHCRSHQPGLQSLSQLCKIPRCSHRGDGIMCGFLDTANTGEPPDYE